MTELRMRLAWWAIPLLKVAAWLTLCAALLTGDRKRAEAAFWSFFGRVWPRAVRFERC